MTGTGGLAVHDGSTYTYMYKNGSLVRFNGVMTQDFTDKIGHSCADDILDIKSDRSDTAWTDPTPASSTSSSCGDSSTTDRARSAPRYGEGGDLQPGGALRHPRAAVSYGCLYGSIEQERPVTFAKDVKTDSSVRGSLTIPTFNYVNRLGGGELRCAELGDPQVPDPHLGH